MNNKTITYSEDRDDSRIFRIKQINETNELISNLMKKSRKEIDRFFHPNLRNIKEYNSQMDYYRALFTNMLGWPLSESKAFNIEIKNEIAEEIIFEDESKIIMRLRIEVTENIILYGILLSPTKKNERAPIVFALHGAKGCPELVSGFYGSSENYNDMVNRTLEKGFIVFVPQLNLWSEEFGPENMREDLDQKLKLLGGSITALEVFKLENALTALIEKKYINKSAKKGIVGLSYGGMYALYTTAVDTRFDAVLSSCWFNEHHFEKGHSDWVFFNAANRFTDEQIAAMVCPRDLYIENGQFDERFPLSRAKEKTEYIKEIYKKLNIENKFKYNISKEGHAFNSEDDGLDWLETKLKI